jgi:mono/diheme cytochrome c family protein
MIRALASAVAVLIGIAGTAAADDDLLAAGREEFMAHCSACHGEDATGDGPHAAELTKRPADLTRITLRFGGTFPADRVFDTIAGLDMLESHRTRDMPIWGDVFVTEAVGKSVKLEDAMKASDKASRRITSLVAYIESIQVKN